GDVASEVEGEDKFLRRIFMLLLFAVRAVYIRPLWVWCGSRTTSGGRCYGPRRSRAEAIPGDCGAPALIFSNVCRCRQLLYEVRCLECETSAARRLSRACLYRF